MDQNSRHPLRIGQRFLICPPENCDPVDDRIPLYLDRARAFGSGLHETTISCLDELEALPSIDGSRILDIGCGTGILSLAAILLGAESAIAYDIDPEAAFACARNARLNGLHENIAVYCGTMEALGSDARFDLILANIYGDIILELSEQMEHHLNDGGALILSGIDFTYVTEIKRSLGRSGLELVKNRMMEEYVTMVWEKRSKIQDPKSKVQT